MQISICRVPNSKVAISITAFATCCLLLTAYLNKDYVIYNHLDTSTDDHQAHVIYIVTPTYRRSTQMADLTRMGQTLALVPNIHWIVVEDAIRMTRSIRNLLERMGIPFTHMIGPTPLKYKAVKYGKGVSTRLRAMEWLRANVGRGVLYFADDDNTYDIRVFEEMRTTQRVSVFPVGLMFGYGFSSPIVVEGQVTGFHDHYGGGRKFAVDMAGFAVNIEFMYQKGANATFVYSIGHLEDEFLRGFNINLEDLEPKAKDCTQILVWHTRTQHVPYPDTKNLLSVQDYQLTNLVEIYNSLIRTTS